MMLNAAELYIPATIKVLGMDSDHRIALWSVDQRKLHFLNDIDDLSEGKLVLFAGDDAYEVAEGIIKEHFEKANPVRVIKRIIAHQARLRTFRAKETIGQGVWRIPGLPGILVVNGNRALQYDNGSWTILSLPMVENRLIELGGNQWVNDGALRQAVDSLTSEGTAEIWDALVGKLGAWQFRNPHDHLIIAGLIIATAIQAALVFRPQVWVVGPTNAGKTALKTFLSSLWPYAEQCENESTEASVRQSIGLDSMPLLLDEQEAWVGRAKLIKTMRSGTRGGTIKRGTTSGKVMEFKVNHISWWFSIEYNLPRAADRNRFALFELLKQEKFIMPALADLGDFGVKLLACAVRCADEITRNWQELANNPEYTKFGRLTEVYALPLAVYRAMTNRDAGVVFAEVMENQSKALAVECPSDEQELLEAILMARPSGSQMPISYYLARGKQQRTGDTTLEESGFKLDTPKYGMVFMATEVVKKHLLAGTKWADANIKLILRRLDGAIETKQRINGSNLNGLSIPKDHLIPVDPKVLESPSVVVPAVQPPPEKPKGYYVSKNPPLMLPAPAVIPLVIAPKESDQRELDSLMDELKREGGE